MQWKTLSTKIREGKGEKNEFNKIEIFEIIK